MPSNNSGIQGEYSGLRSFYVVLSFNLIKNSKQFTIIHANLELYKLLIGVCNVKLPSSLFLYKKYLLFCFFFSSPKSFMWKLMLLPFV